MLCVDPDSNRTFHFEPGVADAQNNMWKSCFLMKLGNGTDEGRIGGSGSLGKIVGKKGFLRFLGNLMPPVA